MSNQHYIGGTLAMPSNTDDGECDENMSVIMRAYGKVCDIAYGTPSKEHTECMSKREELRQRMRAKMDSISATHDIKKETSP